MFLRTFSNGAKDKKILVVGREIFSFFYGFKEFNVDYLRNPDDILNHMEAFKTSDFKLAIVNIILEDTCRLDGISFGLLFKSIYKDSEILFVRTSDREYVEDYYQNLIKAGEIKDFVVKKFLLNFHGCPYICKNNIDLLPEIIKANFRIVDINKNMNEVKRQIEDVEKENEQLKFNKEDDAFLQHYLRTYLSNIRINALRHQRLLEKIVNNNYIKDETLRKEVIQSSERVLVNIEHSMKVCRDGNGKYDLKDCIKKAFDVASVEIPYSFNFNIDDDFGQYDISKIPAGHMEIILSDIMKSIFKTCQSEDMSLSNLLDTKACRLGNEDDGKIILVFITGMGKTVVFFLSEITRKLMKKYGIILESNYNNDTKEQVFNIQIPV